MCHLVLLIPVFGLAVFWIWPLTVALPVYLVIFTISAMVYFALLKAMRQPVKTGKQGLLGEIGEMTDIKDHKGHIAVFGNRRARRHLQNGRNRIWSTVRFLIKSRVTC